MQLLTYMDENRTPIFPFTKRVIRRYPENMGESCYHVTDWSLDVCDMGPKFFQHAKLRGLGNVELKRDPRDGQLKIIECNARIEPLAFSSNPGISLSYDSTRLVAR